MKIRPVEAELFYTDGQTDRHDEATTCFCNFANALKIVIISCRGNSFYIYVPFSFQMKCEIGNTVLVLAYGTNTKYCTSV